MSLELGLRSALRACSMLHLEKLLIAGIQEQEKNGYIVVAHTAGGETKIS
jgi:hypothetical protein